MTAGRLRTLRAMSALPSLLVLLAACLCVGPASVAPPRHAALQALPGRMAWAWERPEDLRWLPADAGVAYVATSVGLQGDAVLLRPRANPLQVPRSAALVPVVHVDASTRQPPALSPAQRDAIVQQLLRAAQVSPTRVVQLDFEARLSQRAFLADVVRAARRALPADVALSMTALASWCAGDRWMQALPADEIVPMAFRMSRDSSTLRRQLAEHGRFRACPQAIGSATDEPLPAVGPLRHYVFSPRPWTASAWFNPSLPSPTP